MSIQENDARPAALVTRRSLVRIAGVTLVATALVGTTGCASLLGDVAPALFPEIETGPIRPETVAGLPVGTLNGGTKPVYVARAGSRDPAEHSVADTLFWGDIMMEHAMFFVMLMPGPELAQPRGEAEEFQRRFTAQLARLRGGRLSGDDYAGFNRTTIELTRSFIAYKQRMEEAQSSGRMHSLVWPSFFDHTRKEAERFARRLDQLNRGDAGFSRAEVVPFWADKMEEHSLFIAHLLDPDERVLIEAAEESAESFARLEATAGGGSRDAAMSASQLIINFKTAAARGIDSGAIDSIIHPALADHVRREAVRFQDELRRAA